LNAKSATADEKFSTSLISGGMQTSLRAARFSALGLFYRRAFNRAAALTRASSVRRARVRRKARIFCASRRGASYIVSLVCAMTRCAASFCVRHFSVCCVRARLNGDACGAHRRSACDDLHGAAGIKRCVMRWHAARRKVARKSEGEMRRRCVTSAGAAAWCVCATLAYYLCSRHIISVTENEIWQFHCINGESGGLWPQPATTSYRVWRQ